MPKTKEGTASARCSSTEQKDLIGCHIIGSYASVSSRPVMIDLELDIRPCDRFSTLGEIIREGLFAVDLWYTAPLTKGRVH